MFTHLNFQTTLGATITASLIVSAVAALIALVLTVVGSTTLATLVAVLALVMVAGCAYFAATQLGGPDDLDDVLAAADELATERLPRLANALLDDSELDGFDEFAGASDEGVGRIIAALNSIQADAHNAAVEQRAQVREGVSNLVVNLVRRNQGLLERQLFHIDRLESSEEDPERLEDLYGVDHLASRMRRNAESLLVLAGLDPQRRKGDPISINDLMRVAMGEIEGYQNVRIVRVDDAEVSAQAALELAHLLSELLENATQFSPPTAVVELAGRNQSDGAYLISIVDAGIGMSYEQLDQYNQLLVDPPELSLGLSRSLGFIVVARLAQRLGLTVELTQTEEGAGVTALVLVPAELLGGQAPAPTPERSESGSTPEPEAVPPAASAPSLPEAGVVPVEQFEPVTADDEPAWVPPSMPERRSTDSGAPAEPVQPAEPVGPAAPELEPFEPTVPVADAGEPEADRAAKPQSPALAKLLGIDPDEAASSTADAEPAVPQRLDEAIPSGEQFDAGVAGLLETGDSPAATMVDRRAPQSESTFEPTPDAGPPDSEPIELPPQRTAKGLTKRDRSKSRAPIGEGRVIPDAGSSATASSRKPEEIREMLARYRKAREGNNPEATPEAGGAQ